MREAINRARSWLWRWRIAVGIGLATAACAGAVAWAWGIANTAHDAADDARAASHQNRVLLRRVESNSRRADREIFESRVAGVNQICLKFNDFQGVVSDLVRAALSVPPRQDVLAHVRQHVIDRFRRDLKLLEPNDCVTQKRKLKKALRDGDFSKSVPYSPNP